jgi:predicted TIM-barrel fold metal-dependent hydrolase
MTKQLQTFLNYFLETHLEVDGIQGEKTNLAIREAITKMQKKFAKEKLIWNSDFNFIGLRTYTELKNLCTDWFVEFELDDEDEVVEKKAAPVDKKAVCAAPKEAVAKKAV